MPHLLYRHRVNTLDELAGLPSGLGIELDLRSSADDVIVTHDPFTEGVRIEEYFPRIGRRPCIFNIKCEGIEPRVLALAKQHGIEHFFLLDCSVPAAVKLWRSGERRFAVRWSEYEPVEGVLAWAGKADWCWVDCFQSFPSDQRAWAHVAEHFAICLVSPELQGHAGSTLLALRAQVAGRDFSAVCTKRPELWLEHE